MSLRQAARQALEVLTTFNADDSVFKGEFDQEITSLRTALAEPDRKPLTDEEIERLARQAADLPWNVVNRILESNFVRAIERAHGIGGET